MLSTAAVNLYLFVIFSL